jgi:hypothetical protein
VVGCGFSSHILDFCILAATPAGLQRHASSNAIAATDGSRRFPDIPSRSSKEYALTRARRTESLLFMVSKENATACASATWILLPTESQFYWTKGQWTKGQFHEPRQLRILHSSL